MKLEELRKDWDALGRIDPMWAVLTRDEDAFFETGRTEIAGVMRFQRGPSRRRWSLASWR